MYPQSSSATQWGIDHPQTQYSLAGGELLLHTHTPPDTWISDPSMMDSSDSPSTLRRHSSSFLMPSSTLVCPVYQGDSATMECIDTKYYGPIHVTWLDADYPELCRLRNVSRIMFEERQCALIGDPTFMAHLLFRNVAQRNPPIFIDRTNRGGLWLLPSNQDPDHCPSFVAHLMWRIQSRWTLVGVCRGEYDGALLMWGPLVDLEHLLLDDHCLPLTLAYFGKWKLERKRYFEQLRLASNSNTQVASDQETNQNLSIEESSSDSIPQWIPSETLDGETSSSSTSQSLARLAEQPIEPQWMLSEALDGETSSSSTSQSLARLVEQTIEEPTFTETQVTQTIENLQSREDKGRGKKRESTGVFLDSEISNGSDFVNTPTKKEEANKQPPKSRGRPKQNHDLLSVKTTGETPQQTPKAISKKRTLKEATEQADGQPPKRTYKKKASQEKTE